MVLWNFKLTLLFIFLKVGTNKVIQTAVFRSGAYPGFWAWIFNIISKQLFPLILQVGTNKVIQTAVFRSGAYPGFWAWIFNIISKQLFPLILQVRDYQIFIGFMEF